MKILRLSVAASLAAFSCIECHSPAPATGGSFSSTGPTIADGMLFVNSGCGGQDMDGNALLTVFGKAA